MVASWPVDPFAVWTQEEGIVRVEDILRHLSLHFFSGHIFKSFIADQASGEEGMGKR